MIVGLVRPDAGRICADGEDITRVPMYMRARQYGISYLPQEASVFRKLTVEENMLAVLEAQSISAATRRARTEKLLDQLSLGHIRKTRGYQLSGGERRRVEIARCLCIQPSFILLDEPFSGIDPDRRRRFAGDYLRPEGQRYRSIDYRPQCARDACLLPIARTLSTRAESSGRERPDQLGSRPRSAPGLSRRRLFFRLICFSRCAPAASIIPRVFLAGTIHLH